MAGSVNKVILIGNLGKDPEIRTMQTGGRLANMTIATSESWKDKQTGERKDRTQWHNVVIFNEALVNVAENYLKKGAKVYIEGQLETRKWQDQQGQDRYTTEVVLRPFRGELTMLDAKGGSSSSGGGFREEPSNDYNAGSQGGGFAGGGARQAKAAAPAVDEFEDEIPF